jgi:hypothetical protein
MKVQTVCWAADVELLELGYLVLHVEKKLHRLELSTSGTLLALLTLILHNHASAQARLVAEK